MAKKILILEDEIILSELLKKKLTGEGYTVTTAIDGAEGLKKMKEDIPDLVLLDIVMPNINGIEVLELMRQSDELKTIPVIIISNSGQPVEIDKAQRLGASDWLIKTEFDPQTVVEKVFNQIGK